MIPPRLAQHMASSPGGRRAPPSRRSQVSQSANLRRHPRVSELAHEGLDFAESVWVTFYDLSTVDGRKARKLSLLQDGSKR